MSKFMKIEVEAKLLLTVPSAKDDEKAADVVLAVEQHINNCEILTMLETGTHVGIRIHVKDFKGQEVTR